MKKLAVTVSIALLSTAFAWGGVPPVKKGISKPGNCLHATWKCPPRWPR